MKHFLSDSSVVFNFSKDNDPVLRVNPGDEVVFQTMDCFSNQIQCKEDRLESMDWDKINPATGPVFIEGAEATDVLKVTIVSIELCEKAVLATGKDLGVLGYKLNNLYSKVVPIKDGFVVFDDKLSIPVKPMIGVIGVAPTNDAISCGTPGSHGGNMDNAKIGEGSVLYLPVSVSGALFGLGDIHAVMGDGEIGVSGAEAPAKVTVKLELIKNLKLNNPVLENAKELIAIASDENLELAVTQAVKDMEELLSKRISLCTEELATLFSLVGNTEICQVVDPLRTARFTMPKWVLEKYNFRLF